LNIVNTATLTPRPKAIVPTMVAVNVGDRLKLRQAYRTSCLKVSRRPTPRASRHWSSISGFGPNRARALWCASDAGMPAAMFFRAAIAR
jgi:hypothetical protein